MTTRGPAGRAGAASLITLGAVALTVLWLATTLTWPFGWDHGIFAWVASVILEGGMPYRDAADIKGPLVYYVYALAQAVFGANTWGIHVVDGAIMVAGACALGSIVNRFAPSAGVLAACGLLLCIGSLGFWSSAQPDGWAGLLATGAVALLLRDDAGRAKLVAAAALAGTAALVKPFYLLLALLPVGSAAFVARGVRPRRQRTVDVALAVLGALLPVVVAITWLALNGALDDAIDVHLRFTAASYSGIGDLALVGRVRGLLDFMARVPVLVLMAPAAAAGGWIVWRTDRHAAALLLAWPALALFFIVLQNRYYLYHATTLFPPVIVLAAIGFHAAFAGGHRDAQRVTLSRILGGAQLLLVAFATLQQPLLDIRRAARYATGLIDAGVYYRGFAPMYAYDAADERAVIRLLRERSTPSEHVVILGYNAGILYQADRPAVSRFGASMPWVLDSGAPIAQRFQREFHDAIDRSRPRWVVLGAVDGAPRSVENRLRIHGAIGHLVESRYCRRDQIGHYVLFERCTES